ncbi:MAG: hypothetical protein ABIS36_22090 [Chryseolinea sp.]
MTLLAHSVAHGQILVGPVAGGNYSFTSFGDKDLKSLYKVGEFTVITLEVTLRFR